jgi:hypothetical protein
MEKSEKPERLSLAGKIAAACDAVGGVEKKGVNELQRYKYVKAADVAKAIRHELFSRGVIILADEKELAKTGEIPTRSGGILREFTLKVDYTLLDSDSDARFTVSAFGVAMDSGDKAIYKCKTGALKYFLRTLGLIPDEKDDPEADEEVDQKIKEAEARFDAKEDVYLAERIAPFQVKALEERWRANAWTEKQVAAFLITLGKYVQLEEIAKAHFNDAMKAFSKPPQVPSDLTEALQASLPVTPTAKPAAKTPAAPRKGPNRFAKLFAITGKKKISDEDLRQTAREIYGKDHLSDLNAEELAWMEGWAEEQTGQ